MPTPINRLSINNDKTHFFLEIWNPDANEVAKTQDVIKASDVSMSFRVIGMTDFSDATELELFIKGQSYLTLVYNGQPSDDSKKWNILGVDLSDVGNNQDLLPNVWSNYLALWGLD